MAGGGSGTVTFLFTDVEGSTRRWQDEPDAMRARLAEHDEVLRTAVESCRGRVFKHTGDGVAAVFASADDAVSAAVAAQAGLAAVLPVRMGLHTGEAEARDGDFFGSTLNRCARVMAVAHGGQVLLSAATAELVRDRGDLRDLGEHRLRDLLRAERVWQVGGGEFPALRSLDSTRTNLPQLGNVFVGRDAELAAIAADLAESRLVTLTGVGGVGKTRLAVQAAAELLPRFADGVWVCELAAAADGDAMVRVVAAALGVVQRQQMSLAESIVDFLRTRELLVVFDNCEHLLDEAAGLIEIILAGAPRVRVVATSREALALPQERIRPLRSLDTSGDAVELFVERARAAGAALNVDARGAETLVELCRRLDGIPLAIELAAARAATMTPGDILGHLDERFRLLTGGRRGRVERHQTLRAAVEWSYSLLEATERAVFDRLGVFPAGFDEAAAVAVCAPDGLERWDVIDGLASLTAKSMIGVDHTHQTARYQLLETLRHFARDHVGDLDGLRHHHATHYAGVAEQAGPKMHGPDDLAWLSRVRVEFDNLRTAVAWALDAPDTADVGLGVRIIDALAVFRVMESSAWLGWEAPALARVDELTPTQRASIDAASAWSAYLEGDLRRAQQLARRALAEPTRSQTVTGIALFALAGVEAGLGDADGVAAVKATARQLLGDDGTPDWLRLNAHAVLSAIGTFTGDRELARIEAAHAVGLARHVGSAAWLAAALTLLGHALCDDAPDDALAAIDEALPLFEAGANSHQYASALMDLAALRARAGDTQHAAEAAHHALKRWADYGNRLGVTSALGIALLVLAQRPDTHRAAATIHAARHGPTLGHIPHIYGAAHRDAIDHAHQHVVDTLGPDAANAAHRHGAAMDYDTIIAYTLEQLRQINAS